MIEGKAEVRWELRQKMHGVDRVTSDEYTEEDAAREAFDEAAQDRSCGEAKLVMVLEVEASTHSKTPPRGLRGH